MEDTPINQKLAEEVEQPPLTLDLLSRRMEQLAENQNRIYEVAIKHTEEKCMNLAREQAAREGIYTQGFNMINATLAAYTAQFDAVLDELHEKVGTDKQEFIESVQKKTEAIINQQVELMQKRAEAEGLLKGKAPAPSQPESKGSPSLTEV